MAVRYIDKFEDRSGAISVSFPTEWYNWTERGNLIVPSEDLVGVDYAFEALENSYAKKAPISDVVRGLISEATSVAADAVRDDIANKMYLAKLGKLWTIDDNGNRYWAYSRLINLPEFAVDFSHSFKGLIPFIAEFRRISDWFNDTLTTVTERVTSSGQTWTVNNPGGLPAKIMTVRLRANTSGGFTNPQIDNNSNLYSFKTNRDSASSNSEVRLITGKSLEYSNDDGASYSNDIANLVLPSNNAPLAFQLEPGDNTLEGIIDGTPNVDVVISFYAPMTH